MTEGGWYDVSLPIGDETPVFPGDPAVEVEAVATHATHPYHLSRVAMGSHTGTHFDAPAHFIDGGQTAPEVPLARLNGPVWVLGLPDAPAITAEALAAAWPGTPGPTRVLFKTPNSALWGTPEAGKRYQALSEAGARWLLARGVTLVGIDCLSIEADETGTYPVHHALLGAGCLIVEGLDLRAIVPGPYEMLCLPLKLTAPDGAPVRAILRTTGISA